MNKWSDYYKIVEIENPDYDPEKWMLFDDNMPWKLYQIIDPSDTTIGTYRDFKYAKKQAKYKFKCLQAKLEKILLA